MSTLAKVFITINLFLTGVYVFMVAALLAQKNDYREKVAEERKKLEEQVNIFKEDIVNAKKEVESTQEEIAKQLERIQEEKALAETYRSHIRVLEDRKAEKEQ